MGRRTKIITEYRQTGVDGDAENGSEDGMGWNGMRWDGTNYLPVHPLIEASGFIPLQLCLLAFLHK